MIIRFWNHWLKRRTKNFTRIPLFTMYFNHGEWEEDKKSKSCHFYCHAYDVKQRDCGKRGSYGGQ